MQVEKEIIELEKWYESSKKDHRANLFFGKMMKKLLKKSKNIKNKIR